MKQDSFYITTPIYYPSGVPHMGHAYSSILADVFARYMRNDGAKVFFLTGTDEHGLKIQNAAEKNSMKPLEYCNKISKVFKDLTVNLNLSNDDFIRTTEKRHYKAVHEGNTLDCDTCDAKFSCTSMKQFKKHKQKFR